MKLPNLPTRPLPRALPLRKLIGPSFILLGLGLGSGEVILWPFLASNYGMGIIWGAMLGITLQFFMNMEIERYALARGESVFVGLKRKISGIPGWFLLSTIIPWLWPGIAAASATVFAHLLGFSDESVKWIAIAMLVLMGAILSLGPVLYKTLEKFEMLVIAIGVPAIFVISIYIADGANVGEVARGLVGNGDGFWFLPAGISTTVFLGALAYAGAGGNLNLAQAFYVKEKGLGMGKHSGRITSVITGKKEKRSVLTGSKFKPTPANLKQFKKWWRNINIEHFTVFWLTGAVTILLLSLLAFNTTFGTASDSDISFVIQEGAAIGEALTPWVGTAFLTVVAFTLFGTQMTVYDASSRIISENAVLASNLRIKDKDEPKVYYFTLWTMILAGILVFLFITTKPLELIVLSAVLNAVAMFVHSGLTLWLNRTSLPRAIGPNKFRTFVMSFAFLFYGGFSIVVINDKLVHDNAEKFETMGGEQIWTVGLVAVLSSVMVYALYKILQYRSKK